MDAKAALNLARLARYCVRRARECDERGEDSGTYRRTFRILIQTLKAVIGGEISPKGLAELNRILEEFLEKVKNSGKPLDNSSQSGSIKLETPHEDGGAGSGNWGHKGVPGQVGGSAPTSGSNASSGSSSQESKTSAGGSGGSENKSSAPASSDSPKKADTPKSSDKQEKKSVSSDTPKKPENHKSGASSGQTQREKITERLVGQTTHDGIEIKSISKHAFDRIGGRKISMGRIEKMITTGRTSDGNQPDTRVYDIDGSRIVINPKTGNVVTIMWRKGKKK